MHKVVDDANSIRQQSLIREEKLTDQAFRLMQNQLAQAQKREDRQLEIAQKREEKSSNSEKIDSMSLSKNSGNFSENSKHK